jgi:hypothetical protein
VNRKRVGLIVGLLVVVTAEAFGFARSRPTTLMIAGFNLSGAIKAERPAWC